MIWSVFLRPAYLRPWRGRQSFGSPCITEGPFSNKFKIFHGQFWPFFCILEPYSASVMVYTFWKIIPLIFGPSKVYQHETNKFLPFYSHVYLTLTVPLFRCFLVFIGKYDDDKLNTWSILWEFECEFECEYVCVSGNVSKCVMRYRGLRYLTSWLSPIPANKYTLQNFRWLLLLTTTN